MKCGYATCRYNKDNLCTHEDDGKLCKNVCSAVLGINEDGCEFCNKYHTPKGGVLGKHIPVKPTVSSKESSPDRAEIYISTIEEPCIMLFNQCLTAGYIDIKYCPMCGRKLNQEDEKVGAK
jgi:hypothetical protein